jgi:hypothetical protein
MRRDICQPQLRREIYAIRCVSPRVSNVGAKLRRVVESNADVKRAKRGRLQLAALFYWFTRGLLVEPIAADKKSPERGAMRSGPDGAEPTHGGSVSQS